MVFFWNQKKITFFRKKMKSLKSSKSVCKLIFKFCQTHFLGSKKWVIFGPKNGGRFWTPIFRYLVKKWKNAYYSVKDKTGTNIIRSKVDQKVGQKVAKKWGHFFGQGVQNFPVKLHFFWCFLAKKWPFLDHFWSIFGPKREKFKGQKSISPVKRGQKSGQKTCFWKKCVFKNRQKHGFWPLFGPFLEKIGHGKSVFLVKKGVPDFDRFWGSAGCRDHPNLTKTGFIREFMLPRRQPPVTGFFQNDHFLRSFFGPLKVQKPMPGQWNWVPESGQKWPKKVPFLDIFGKILDRFCQKWSKPVFTGFILYWITGIFSLFYFILFIFENSEIMYGISHTIFWVFFGFDKNIQDLSKIGQIWCFWPKMTHFWPFFGHFLAHFWTIFRYQFLMILGKKGSKKWSKKWYFGTFGGPIFSVNNYDFGQKYHFLTTFLVIFWTIFGPKRDKFKGQKSISWVKSGPKSGPKSGQKVVKKCHFLENPGFQYSWETGWGQKMSKNVIFENSVVPMWRFWKKI